MGSAAHKPGYLFERLCEPSVLENAWARVLVHFSHDQRPPEVAALEERRAQRIAQLADDLRREVYAPEPAALVSIPKPSKPGERRTISVLRAEDRLVLTALEFLLDPLLSRDFFPRSFAYRKGLGAGAALRQVRTDLARGCSCAASVDIDNFFDSISRPRLLDAVRSHVWEKQILRLLEIYLEMGAHRGVAWVESTRGIAQGSPLSPLLANYYLLPLDRELSRWTGAFPPSGWIRYADNLLLTAPERNELEEGIQRATAAITTLELRWNSAPAGIRALEEGFVFLGYRFEGGNRERIDDAKLAEMERTLAERLPLPAADPGRCLEELSHTLGGWRRYYSRPETVDQIRGIDQDVTRRLGEWVAHVRQSPGGPPRKLWEDWLGRMERLLSEPENDAGRQAWIREVLDPKQPEAPTVAKPAEVAAPDLPAKPPPTPRQVVAKRKREYAARQREVSDFLVTEPGTFLGVRGDHLQARRDRERVAEVPLAQIRHITLLVHEGAISCDLMVRAAEHGIAIELLGYDGKPAARIGAPESPSFETSLAQSRLSGTVAGLALAQTFVAGKIRNQSNVLRYFLKYRARAKGAFSAAAAPAVEQMARLERDAASRRYDKDADARLERDRLFAVEGQAAQLYWDAIHTLLDGHAAFAGRVRRGARDTVNELLNYGYGILSARLLGVLSRAGLNPNISFLHTPQPGKPALLYDFLEEFRAPVVDRTVFARLGKGLKFERSADGMLSLETRRTLAKAVIQRLNATTSYEGRKLPILAVMDGQAARLVDHVTGKRPYRSFVMPW